MVPLAVPGEEETYPDDPSISSDVPPMPFQEELRLHLQAIQCKLDLLADNAGVSTLCPPLESARMMPSGWLRPGTPELERPQQPPGSRLGARMSSSPHLDFVLPGCPSAGAIHRAGSTSGHASGRERGKRPRADKEPSTLVCSGPFQPPNIGADDLEDPAEQYNSHASASVKSLEVADECSPLPGTDARGPSRAAGDSVHDRLSVECVRIGRLRSWLDLNGPEAKPARRFSLDPLGVVHFVSRLGQRRDIRWKEVQERRLWHVVHGTYFQVMSSIAIVLNVVVIGTIADARLQAVITRTQEAPWWDYVEMAFCAFFTLELLVRAVAEDIFFLCGTEWKWNLFDSFLVAFSLIDITLNDVMRSSGSNGITNMTTARILRFVRFIRVIRIARAVRVFHSLRIVVFAIFESMLSLIWCLLVVGLIIYLFAVFFLYGVTEHFNEIVENGDSKGVASALLEYYGSVPRAVITLFMAVSGGVDWRDPLKPLQEVHWLYEPIFTFYIFFMVIGVLNVVVGAFVAATAEISSRDRDFLVKTEISNLQAYSQKIKTFFHEADKDKSGKLSWPEFKTHLKVPKVSAYFRALELDVSQAHTLFKLLDNDGSNEVSMDEFLQGCMRLKGQAKSLEVNMLLYENKRMMTKLSGLIKVIAEKVVPNEEHDARLLPPTPGLHSKLNTPRATPSPTPSRSDGPSAINGAHLHPARVTPQG